MFHAGRNSTGEGAAWEGRKSSFTGKSEADHMRGDDFDGRRFLDTGSDHIQSTGRGISERRELRTSRCDRRVFL